MSGRAARVNAATLAILPDLLGHWLPGGEYRGHLYVALNPLRNDRSLGSFQIDTQTGQWADHAVNKCSGRDPVSLYAYLFTQGNYREAIRQLGVDPFVQAAIATGATTPATNTAKPAKASGNKMALAQRIYRGASGVSGTPAEAYLLGRALLPTKAWESLRWSLLRYPGRGRHHALIAAVTAIDGALVGMHRTYLQPDGAKLDVEPVRLGMGQVRGHAIRLGDAHDRLIICEGLEDGLTLHQELNGHPVWVSTGASLMAAMRIPDTIRTLRIAADNDRAGEMAAQNAADAHNILGRDVRIMRPAAAFKDFNDQLRGITNVG